MKLLYLLPLFSSLVAARPLAACTKPCEGTNPTNTTLYVCGDARLGPKQLPKTMPLKDLTHPYDRFGGLCAKEYLAKWADPTTGFYNYPPANGFQLDVNGNPIMGNASLPIGTLVDRFGSEYGSFLAPYDSPYPQRSLPPSNLDTSASAPDYPYNYHVYNVTQAFVVASGPIAPWFGQPGEGTQFLTYSNIMTLVSGGFLARVDPSTITSADTED